MQTVHHEATTTADQPAVWRLLDDSASWPGWTPIEEHLEERAPGAGGTGEIRVFVTGRVRVREEIVERREPDRLSYVLLGGLAVRDYRADIDLAPVSGGGTHITWHTTFRPKIAGTGWLYRRTLQKVTQQFVDGLANEAAREASGVDG